MHSEEIEESRRLVVGDAKRVQVRREKLKAASERMEKAIDALIASSSQK